MKTIYQDPPYFSKKLTLDETLREHLHYNFMPPVTAQMVEPCKEAIKAMRENEPERMIKVGDFYLNASAIVEDLKLDSIIEFSEGRNIEKELDEMFEKAPDKSKFLMDLLKEVYD